MNVTDFAKGSAWAIVPESFEAIARDFKNLKSEKFDSKLSEYLEIEKAGLLPRKGNAEDFYSIRDGIAIIPVAGPLSKRMSLFSWIMGGISYPYVRLAVRTAMEDDDVRGIVLNVDSPGGTVSGAEATAEMISNMKGQKPVIAFANGMMASSAYWISSGADAIVTENTAQVGSIGILMIHRDYSESDRKEGVKTTYLTAGKYKALGNDSEPLSDFARSVFQDELDYVYSIFVNNVAQNRDIEIDAALKAADGKIFIGQQAVDVGLADRIGSLSLAVEMARAAVKPSNRKGSSIMSKEIEIKTIEQLAATYPDLVAEIHKRGVSSVDVKSLKETAELEATTAERDRIVGLVTVHSGEESGEKLRAIIESGVTVDQFKAIKALEPEKIDDPIKDKMLEAITDAGADNPGPGNGEPDPKDYLSLVREYQVANSVTKFEAMKEINKQYPDARKSFLKKVNG